jgi:hypothetical protein
VAQRRSFPAVTSRVRHRNSVPCLGVEPASLPRVEELVAGLVVFHFVITFGDLLDFRVFIRHSKRLDFIIGFLFPLDCYAVLILFSVPLPN